MALKVALQPYIINPYLERLIHPQTSLIPVFYFRYAFEQRAYCFHYRNHKNFQQERKDHRRKTFPHNVIEAVTSNKKKGK